MLVFIQSLDCPLIAHVVRTYPYKYNICYMFSARVQCALTDLKCVAAAAAAARIYEYFR